MNTEPVLLSTAVRVNLFNLPHSNKIELTLGVLLTDTPLARPSSKVQRLVGAACRWSGICEVTVCLERNSFLHSTWQLYISEHRTKRKKNETNKGAKKKNEEYTTSWCSLFLENLSKNSSHFMESED
jgi:hypothetical protein